MSMKLENKTVLITGGGTGIGLGLAKELTQFGCNTVLVGRNETTLQSSCEQIPNSSYYVCDISDTAQVKRLADAWGDKIDILINNAGVFNITNYNHHQNLDTLLNEININFGGPIRMVHFFLPYLKKKKGSAIVNVSSSLAFLPIVALPVYSATKAALHSWTISLRAQLKMTDIAVYELMPPFVKTNLVEEFKNQDMLSVEFVSKDFVKNLLKNKHESTPKKAGILKAMARIAPKWMLNKLNAMHPMPNQPINAEKIAFQTENSAPQFAEMHQNKKHPNHYK